MSNHIRETQLKNEFPKAYRITLSNINGTRRNRHNNGIRIIISWIGLIFEVESWRIAKGKAVEHKNWMRRWLRWVNDHKELFPEWKSVRYFVKTIAGDESERHMVVWEYESLAAFEAYKARRGDYQGPYEEYKENDPYYQGVFDHSSMRVEVWRDLERELWIE